MPVDHRMASLFSSERYSTPYLKIRGTAPRSRHENVDQQQSPSPLLQSHESGVGGNAAQPPPSHL